MPKQFNNEINVDDLINDSDANKEQCMMKINEEQYEYKRLEPIKNKIEITFEKNSNKLLFTYSYPISHEAG